MRSVLLIAWSNLRRRWGQAVLVGSILMLSALVFFTGAGVLREIERPFTEMFARQAGAHFTMIFEARIHDPDSVRAWWGRQPGVAAVSEAMPAVGVTDQSYFRGAPLSRLFMVTERPPIQAAVDSIRVVAGREGAGPGPGEIWIPTSLAYEANIQPGDTLEIPAATGLDPFVVSAVVVDPIFSAPFNNPLRVWVAPGELPAHFGSAGLGRVIVSVRLADAERSDSLWNRFLADQGGAFNGFFFGYADVKSGYTAPYTLMAALILAFSILGFVVALFAIHGTVTSALLADFRLIGILRTQGFTPRDVRRVYELQYLLLAAVAIPAGVGLGFVAVRATVGALTRTIATTLPPGSLFGLAIATLLGFGLAVYLFVLQVARAAGRVRPAEAIRSEARPERARAAGIGFGRLRRLSVPWLVGIRNLGLQPRRTAFLTAAIGFAALAAAMAVNLDHSIENLRANLAVFGLDNAAVRVSRSGRRFQLRHEDLMAALKDRPGVTAVATWDMMDGQLERPDGRPTRPLNGNVIDGDMDGLGYLNLRGRNPAGAGEISLAVHTAEALGKSVGDTVVFRLFGGRLPLRVAGIYQSINNTGEGFRVRLEAVRLLDPLWAPVEYGVALADGVPVERFMADLEAEYGEAVDAKTGDYFVKDQLASVAASQRAANAFLALVFLAAAAVFIVNTTLLSIGENRRVFGILKTAGMTPAELRRSVVSGVAVQSVAGVVVGLVLWWLGGQAFLSLLFRGVGLVDFPLRNSLVGTALTVPVIIGFSLLAAWLPSAAVLDVNPRSLIVE